MIQEKEQQRLNFNAIRLKLASPDELHEWSHGEVLKPETINYRTQKPEKDGLFCEKIFGPSKDWECYCGKYKRIRYKGIVCDKCGVEVTRSLVRRERMGHIDLAVPVTHIWFLRGVPSKIGLILDLSVQNLEKVIYFANFIITKVDDELRQETIKQIDSEYKSKRKIIESDFNRRANEAKQVEAKLHAVEKDTKVHKKAVKEVEQELINNAVNRDEKLKDLQEAVELARKELKELKPLQIISENKYQDLSLKYGHVFEAGIGAETIRKLLEEINLDKLIKVLEAETEKASKNQMRRVVRRLKLVKNIKKNNIRPEWMVLTAVPVIPPDLRPMVQLDGGRFAASDLNDLYRRVINRNNRLKRLLDLNAPEVITRNEKRMLQEAVDALIDNNARHGKTVTASTGQRRQLKSLADMLKGKQGRFRQNLLGKRVDYSGRSVIVVGPHLKLDQCGIPKKMALELFKPFVISQLIKREYVHNVRSANRFIESGRDEVWDILEEVTQNSHVLLNRAPTLHRLGIQAFQPVLIEGNAIQLHPLVCPPFNADFDGDQMAVHVPLTQKARDEAKNLMLATHNILKPATGEPVITPSQDIVLGCYYLTSITDENKPVKKFFATEEEAVLAYEIGTITVQTKIGLMHHGKRIETSVGRILFNEIFPEDVPYQNKVMDKKNIKDIIKKALYKDGSVKTAELLDQIKKMSLAYLTRSGLSWGMGDTPIPAGKKEAIEEAEKKIDEVHNQYEMGLLTKDERYVKSIDIWASTKNEVQEISKNALDPLGSVFAMIDSGARGSWGQITQMMGMKGLVTNPAGETIELPVKGSFKEGFDVLEYFISTHGTRKGLSDTALRTANAGYLTRRLVDVAQDVVVRAEDCKDVDGYVMTREQSEEIGEELAKRILGRVSLDDIKSGKKVLVKKGELITEKEYEKIKDIDLQEARVRSTINCKTIRGVCRRCYGYDLGRNKLVEEGEAVGIIAAQSIGEPGTQLTMRTFHTGGVAGQDITQGLPRVEELFEARPVKKAAIISEIDGQASISEEDRQKVIKVVAEKPLIETYDLAKSFKKANYTIKVKNGTTVGKGDVLVESEKGKTVKAKVQGKVSIEKSLITVSGTEENIEEYTVPVGFTLWVKDGDLVTAGQQLTEGSLNLQELYRLKGKDAVQRYVIKEIQYIYSSQGQRLNDKHIEIVVRQMFSRYYVKDAGDTDLLSGDIISEDQILEANNAIKKGEKKAVGENLLLGITKASLSTDSFLAAASFQETARVLIDASISGRVDRLRGLKENVIIGKLIPVGTGYKKDK
ncbi:DNA-directed RNA polymerase subunit beta' [Patescibacteria group bacterium]|nr:DNA-directed RNA polymerase subunit beta' [Patescibacteria group bacterium]